jgi:hypothetical protein
MNRTTKKLRLNRETIAHLNSDELVAIAGGTGPLCQVSKAVCVMALKFVNDKVRPVNNRQDSVEGDCAHYGIGYSGTCWSI